jgi:hypothetical protein
MEDARSRSPRDIREPRAASRPSHKSLTNLLRLCTAGFGKLSPPASLGTSSTGITGTREPPRTGFLHGPQAVEGRPR